jgi:hypothetical protein
MRRVNPTARRRTRLGEHNRLAAPVSGVLLAQEVAPQHEGVDELAGGLLGGADVSDQIGRRGAPVGHPPEHEGGVARQVVEAGGGHSSADID